MRNGEENRTHTVGIFSYIMPSPPELYMILHNAITPFWDIWNFVGCTVSLGRVYFQPISPCVDDGDGLAHDWGEHG